MSRRVLRVHAGATTPTSDTDLELYSRPGLMPVPGTAVDDRLDAAARKAVDEDAQRDLAAWRTEWDESWTADGACLTWIHEVELLVDVFHRERLALTGFTRMLSEQRPEAVEVTGADAPLQRALHAVAADAGISVRFTGAATATGTVRQLEVRGSLGALRELVGTPAVLRGDVLMQYPDRHLAGVRAALARQGHRAVDDILRATGIPPRQRLARIVRGGVIAHPGRRQRRRARLLSARLLAAFPTSIDGASALRELQHSRARALLARRGPNTLAEVAAARRTLAAGRLTALVTGSDAQPAARILAVAGREAGVPLIEVLHGISPGLWSLDGAPGPTTDGLMADRVGAWNSHDVDVLAPHAYGEVRRTGNPGAAMAIRELLDRRGSGGHALVLVQAPGWAVATVSTRAPQEHVTTALAGLTAAGSERPVVLRPHPLDPTVYDSFVEGKVTLARGGHLHDLLADAAVVIGSLSTATLEAAAAGIPTVLLDVTGAPVDWPFDGSAAIPTVSSAEGLATAISASEGATDEAAVAEARDALGADEGAVEAVVSLILGA